jgi:lipid-binding SYLF domain-containing protein
MARITSLIIQSLLILQLVACSTTTQSQSQIAAARINDAKAALEKLYATTPAARKLAMGASGIMVFPEITKAGFIVGGQYGKGVLFRNGRVDGFYDSTSASYGLQAGVQKFGYALFFMNESDMAYLKNSDGWEIGVGPNVTVVDEGFARSLTTTTGKEGIYAFFFEQRGLMAGLGIQGTKITKTDSVRNSDFS